MRGAVWAPAIACLLVAAVAGAERIRSFDARLEVHADGIVAVEERIRWDFGSERRHGIFREIPIAYARPGGADFHIRLRVDGVTDGDGAAVPYTTTTAGGALRIRIGDPDRFVTGERDYRLRYRAERALLFFPDHDEIYWNATGTEWPVPIERATVEVALPDELGKTEAIDAACYTGPMGAQGRACTLGRRGAVVDAATVGPLGLREGLTIAVGFPKGAVREPTALERAFARLLDYGAGWLLVPVLALAGMIGLWRRVGRDPTVGHAIAVRYEPPAGLTPAEIGTLFDERADIDDVTSTIVDLAIRGHLRIDEVESARLLFFSDIDYRLTRRSAPAGAALKRHETALLKGLFESGDTVLVSELRDKFYRHLDGIRSALYGTLAEGDPLFAARPDHVRTGFLVAGGALAILGFFFIAPYGAVAAASLAVAGAIVMLGARAMPRRTRRGREIYEQVLGFKEFLSRVEADRLDRLGGRTAATFEKVLPVAIVLGVADRWAEAFADVYTTPPAWYHGHGDASGFQPRTLVRDVGRSLDTMGRAMASSPKGSGSGSSGSGGGGSSGGGFGGGGGGSW